MLPETPPPPGGDDPIKHLADTIMAIDRSRRWMRAMEEEARLTAARCVHEGRLQIDQGVPTDKGILRRIKERAGRRFPNRDELLKEAGELPLSVRPDHRHFLKSPIERLPTGIQAEIMALGNDDEQPVVVEEKIDYPTVKELEEEFGPKTRFIGEPAAVETVVLEIPTDDPDKPVLLKVPPPPAAG